MTISIAQNCGEDLQKLPPAYACADSLPVMEISRYFSLSGRDLATDQGVECNPHTFAVYPMTISPEKKEAMDGGTSRSIGKVAGPQ
jgi:hypothetical protein